MSEKYVHIIDNYYLTSDEYQYILKKCGTRNKIDRKTKKILDEMIDYEETIGYYGSINSMLLDLAKRVNREDLRNGEFETLEECIDHVKSYYEKLLKIDLNV